MPVTIGTDELAPLRTAMRDLQLSVARYYVGTASGEDLGTLVRAFTSHTQTINDWLTNVVADAASYKANFNSSRHPGADYIEAVKYVRNVSEHVMHIVKPDDTVTLVGGALGMRLYARWDGIPAAVHAKLHRNTQALKPRYDAKLEGEEVMGTMMEVLRFYSSVVPDIIHRNQHGEWTGFPLTSQPGMSNPLHPEEPSGLADARRWMDNRRPGGESRLVCGQVTVDGTPYVYGHTFEGLYSFAPFSETIEQVNRDLALGFPYFTGDIVNHVEDAQDRFPDALQGSVLARREEISSWATPVTRQIDLGDWCSPGFDSEGWRTFVGLENRSIVPEVVRHEVRRARRLNALTPPSASHR